MGPSGAVSCSAAGTESPSGGIVDKRKRKKRLICPQVRPYRDSLTGLITPVSLYLQTFSSDLFAQRDDLCGQFHVVYPGRYNYSCGSVSVGLYLWRVRLK
jgi:hypothetical protein